MNGTIFALTLRQMVSRRRTLMMVLFALLPVLIAVIYRLSDHGMNQQDWAANVLLDGFIVTTLLPLSALIFGTAALGAEIEDGTSVYLLSKPIPRQHVVTAKLLAAWLVTAPLVLASAILAGTIALQGAAEQGILTGFAVATVLGSLVYVALFLLLSVVTSRALIAGLVYVFIWEGIVTELFSGTQFLSVRQYSLGVADLIADTRADIFEAELSGATALVMMGIVGAGAVALAVRRLRSLEISQSA
jgi:ABC-2 type transport system permease protein